MLTINSVTDVCDVRSDMIRSQLRRVVHVRPRLVPLRGPPAVAEGRSSATEARMGPVDAARVPFRRRSLRCIHVRCQPAPRCNSRSTARACIAPGAVLRRELALRPTPAAHREGRRTGARSQPSFRSYAVVGNLLTMFESTMCLQIAGGDGCDEPTPTPGNETSPGA